MRLGVFAPYTREFARKIPFEKSRHPPEAQAFQPGFEPPLNRKNTLHSSPTCRSGGLLLNEVKLVTLCLRSHIKYIVIMLPFRGEFYMLFNNQHKLLSPSGHKKLLNDPNYQSNHKLMLVFVGFGKPSEYEDGFIPGSLYLDTNSIEDVPFWNLVANEQLEEAINELGICLETTVIVYGNKIMAAARAAWAFMYAGLEDVRLLNGGLGAWKAYGYSVEEHPSDGHESKDSFHLLQPKSNYLSTRNEIEKDIHNQDSVVVDVRSWNEYSGQTTGYEYMKEKGRIPHAVWGYAGSDPYHMEDYEEKNGVLKNLEEIEQFWKETGITSDKKATFYCGTGWRASEAFFIAHLLGWQNIRVYDGG